MARYSWTVRPKKRKQHALWKVPAPIVRELGLSSRKNFQLRVTVGSEILYVAPRKLTSGEEVYLPHDVQRLLSVREKARFEVRHFESPK